MEWNPAYEPTLRAFGFTPEQIAWTRAESTRRQLPAIQLLYSMGRLSQQQASILAALPDPRYAQGATLGLAPQQPAGSASLENRRFSAAETLASEATPSASESMALHQKIFKQDRYELIRHLTPNRELVIDRRLERQVHRVKDLSNNPEAFLLRPRWIAALDHPGLPRIHEIHSQSPAWYSMDPPPGPSLTEALRAKLPLVSESVVTLARIFLGAASALQHAHDAEILHGCLRPDVIMLGQFGELRIDGWDTATREGEQALVEAPPGSLLAPERISGDRPELASDIWALTGLFYMTLTGAPPSVLGLEPDWPKRARAGLKIPPEIVAVVTKGLQARRSERYSSASELADDLRSFLDGGGVSAAPESPLTTLNRWRRQNPISALIVGSIALVALLAAIGASLFVAQSAQKSQLARARATALQGELLAAEKQTQSEDARAKALQGVAESQLKMARALDAIAAITSVDLSPEHDDRVQQSFDSAILEARRAGPQGSEALYSALRAHALWRLDQSFAPDPASTVSDLKEILSAADPKIVDPDYSLRCRLFEALRLQTSFRDEVEQILRDVRTASEGLDAQTLPRAQQRLLEEATLREFEARNNSIRQLHPSQTRLAQERFQELCNDAWEFTEALKRKLRRHPGDAYLAELVGRACIARDGFGLKRRGVLPMGPDGKEFRSRDPDHYFLRASLLTPGRAELHGLSLDYQNSRYGLFPSWSRNNTFGLSQVSIAPSRLRPSIALCRLAHTLTLLRAYPQLVRLGESLPFDRRPKLSSDDPVERELAIILAGAQLACGRDVSAQELASGRDDFLACETLLLQAQLAARAKDSDLAQRSWNNAWSRYDQASAHSFDRLNELPLQILSDPGIAPNLRAALARTCLPSAQSQGKVQQRFAPAAVIAGLEAALAGGDDPRFWQAQLDGFKRGLKPDQFQQLFFGERSLAATFQLLQLKTSGFDGNYAKANLNLLMLACDLNFATAHTESDCHAAFEELRSRLLRLAKGETRRALEALDLVAELWEPRVGIPALLDVWTDRRGAIRNRRAR